MLSKDRRTTEGSAAAAAPGTELTRAVTINPGQTKTVGLGTYKAALPDPAFDLHCTPDMKEMIGISLDRLEDHASGKYILLYQLHNFGDKACEITIRQTNESAS